MNYWLRFAVLLLGTVGAVASSSGLDSEVPAAVSLDVLSSSLEDDVLRAVFRDVGLLRIKDVPNYVETKKQVWKSLVSCLEATSSSSTSELMDGTRRTSLARSPDMDWNFPTNQEECQDFVHASKGFQDIILHVTQVITHRIDALLHTSSSTRRNHVPLYESSSSSSYWTFSDVVQSNDYLEHYHMYETASSSFKTQRKALDVHTDMGLFLLFAPGQWINSIENYNSNNEFHVQLPNGVIQPIQFEEDDLVLMLGQALQDLQPQLFRAVPHSLQFSKQGRRLWFGRMMLPPSDAIVPSTEQTVLTFGQLRQQYHHQQQQQDKTTMMVGCGSSSSKNIMVPRLLSDGGHHNHTQCHDNQLYCWLACQNLTDYNITGPEQCTDEGKKLQCIDTSTNQVWTVADSHTPSAKPMCVADATPAPTAAPTAAPSSSSFFLATTATSAVCFSMLLGMYLAQAF